MKHPSLLIAGLFLCAAPALAQVHRPLAATAPASEPEWTAERYARARPMPFPPAGELARDPAPPARAATRSPSRSMPARQPSAGVLPDFDRWIHPPGAGGGGETFRRRAFRRALDRLVFVPTNRGSTGLDFSSTRLVPEDARVVWPYLTVGKLFFRDQGDDFVCSAAVINRRVVLTAGHCVHTPGSGFHSNFSFVPAYHEGNAPVGTWAWSYVAVTGEWANGNGDVPNEADFAMLTVHDQNNRAIGEVTGWLGWISRNLWPNSLHMLGYPGNLDRGRQMHQITTSSSDCCFTNNAVFGSDMRGGSSGGPWVQNFGIKAKKQKGGGNAKVNRVVGVTSWGYVSKKLRAQGSSIPGSSFVEIWNMACGNASGNCR